MSKRKTSTDTASKKSTPASSSPDPVVHQQRETDHDDVQPHDHPQGDKRSRSPSAEDTRVNDGGRSSSEGEVEMGTSEEDARSRRRDLGP